MEGKYPIAETASLFADPARVAILVALLDGRSLPASELAFRARVSAQAASMHLGKLLGGRLVTVSRFGRHRYYSLAGPDVAAALGLKPTGVKTRINRALKRLRPSLVVSEARVNG